MGQAQTKKWLTVLDGHWLGQGNRHLCGSEMTIADIFGAALLTSGHVIRNEFRDYPNIERWLKEVGRLPSWKSADAALNGFRDYVKDQVFANV